MIWHVMNWRQNSENYCKLTKYIYILGREIFLAMWGTLARFLLGQVWWLFTMISLLYVKKTYINRWQGVPQSCYSIKIPQSTIINIKVKHVCSHSDRTSILSWRSLLHSGSVIILEQFLSSQTEFQNIKQRKTNH